MAAAIVPQRLGFLLGESRYLVAERTLRAAWQAMQEYLPPREPVAGTEEALAPTEIVILRGPADIIESWRRQLAALYAPRRVVLAIPAAGEPPRADAALPAALAAKPALPGGVAYVCRGSQCSAPITSWAALVGELGSAKGPSAGEPPLKIGECLFDLSTGIHHEGSVLHHGRAAPRHQEQARASSSPARSAMDSPFDSAPAQCGPIAFWSGPTRRLPA
jgi:hypothetical protein